LPRPGLEKKASDVAIRARPCNRSIEASELAPERSGFGDDYIGPYQPVTLRFDGQAGDVALSALIEGER
jgi:hypothetical protein